MADDIKDGLPAIDADEQKLRTLRNTKKEHYLSISNLSYPKVSAAFGIALHMHQPTIPASHDHIPTAGLISNLKYMLDHENIGDNHNARVFLQCYARMADIIPELVSQGKNPRIMLDYSGNLFWGLRQMGEGWVLENLKRITCDPTYYRHVEWLGTMWSHAVVTSNPIPDIKLHILAWLNHFGAIFGKEALERVKGFSPPEMHLPIHPDVCYEYVKALKECGYEWLMVQEHTIENPDGSGIRRSHFPHRLVAKNSLGEVAEITVLIKTQGSDTKLVAQMQPCYEAQTKTREDYQGKNIPPFVVQIGDGENGGVMMNEFPPAYRIAYNQIGRQGTVGMNGSEYLEFIKKESGLKESEFLPVQPIAQHCIWEFVKNCGPNAVDQIIDKVKQKYPRFNLDRASWTNHISWVQGYENVLDPMNQLSAAFHQKFDNHPQGRNSQSYKEALLYLLLSQTSCFRYWGQGLWTEYAKEICHRGMESVKSGSCCVTITEPTKEKQNQAWAFSFERVEKEEELDMKQKVIEIAGKTWKTLGEKGETNLAQLPKTLKEDDSIVYQALGWLAREDKINYITRNKQIFVSLVDSELRAFRSILQQAANNQNQANSRKKIGV